MNVAEFGVKPETLLDIVSPVVKLFPHHHPDAADINESLDPKIDRASCAVRSYASGLLLRRAYPNLGLYLIDFGFASDHGDIFESEKRKRSYMKMGHAVSRFQIPGQRPLIIESYTNASIEVIPPTEEHDSFIWGELTEGYSNYLQIAGMDDIVLDPEEITDVLVRHITDLG